MNANEKTIHEKCLEFLMVEVYKYFNGLSPRIMDDTLKLTKNTYILRNFDSFKCQILKINDKVYTALSILLARFDKLFPMK